MSHASHSSPPTHPRRASLPLALAFLCILAPAAVRAIQAPELEIGNGGTYDGSVKITRDEQGRMLLRDGEVPTPVSLNDLRYAGRDHSLLLGLGGDGHPQYQNASRHTAAHSAAFNGALATPPDPRGNTTLGAHLTDTNLHPNILAPLTVTGPWTFTKILALASGLNLSGGSLNIGGQETLTPERAALLTQADVDNLRLDGNNVTATNANGDLNLTAGGLLRVKDKDATGTPDRMTIDTAAGALWMNGNLTGGTDGGGGKALTLFSGVAGKSLRLVTSSDGWGYLANDGGLSISCADYITLISGAGQSQYFDAGGFFTFRDKDAASVSRLTIDSATGDINNVGGAYKTGGTTRLSAAGAATLTQADVDNLRLNDNTLASTNSGGDIILAPNGGKVAVTGDLAIGSGGGRLILNGQGLTPQTNLLDNPDFTIWQRGMAQCCAAGGNAAGTILWPVPGTLTTCADRWQVSRARTDTVTTISRATPPGSLPTAQFCLKNEYIAGAAPVIQFLHQTLSREQTVALRGRWVTFAISHFITGTTGGKIGLYKVVGGAPTALATFAFSSTPNTWERVAIAAQVPADAEVLMVGIQSNLAPGGPTAAYLANAALVEGRYVNATEKAGAPAASSLPPLPRHPADDLVACQRYYEKGALTTTFYAINDGTPAYYQNPVSFNTAKASTPAITLSGLTCSMLVNPTASTTPQPAYSPGQTWPQGFLFQLFGATPASGSFNAVANWVAVCPEPI